MNTFLIIISYIKGKYANLWQFISTKTFSQIEKVNFSSLQKMERKLISSPCKTSVMKLRNINNSVVWSAL